MQDIDTLELAKGSFIMQKWKYVSENTTDAVSLHDCGCARIYYKNNRVIIEVEWMEIMDYHPQNKYSEAHQSGQGIIELIEPQIIKCQYEKSGVFRTTSDLPLLEFTNLEFLDFNEIKVENGYENKMFLIKASNEGIYDNLVLILSYKSSIVKFNELHDISWFVEFGKESTKENSPT